MTVPPDGESPDEAKSHTGSGMSDAIGRALAEERHAASSAHQEAAIEDLAQLGGEEARAGIEALLAVAAPDDAERIRTHLGLPKPVGHPRQTTDELADD